MPSDDRILYLALGLLLTLGAVVLVALGWKVARRARASERLEQLGITVGIPKAATVQIALGVVALIALVAVDILWLSRRWGASALLSVPWFALFIAPGIAALFLAIGANGRAARWALVGMFGCAALLLYPGSSVWVGSNPALAHYAALAGLLGGAIAGAVADGGWTWTASPRSAHLLRTLQIPLGVVGLVAVVTVNILWLSRRSLGGLELVAVVVWEAVLIGPGIVALIFAITTGSRASRWALVGMFVGVALCLVPGESTSSLVVGFAALVGVTGGATAGSLVDRTWAHARTARISRTLQIASGVVGLLTLVAVDIAWLWLWAGPSGSVGARLVVALVVSPGLVVALVSGLGLAVVVTAALVPRWRAPRWALVGIFLNAGLTVWLFELLRAPGAGGECLDVAIFLLVIVHSAALGGAIGGAVAGAIADAVAARLRRRRGRCPRCGYSLRGLTEPRCPECGRPVTLPQDRSGATA